MTVRRIDGGRAATGHRAEASASGARLLLATALAALSGSAAWSSPIGEPTQDQRRFERLYEATHAPFICFARYYGVSLNDVDIAWRDGDVWVTESLVDAGRPERVQFRLRLRDLAPAVRVRAVDCPQGRMHRVRVDCVRPCKLRFDATEGEASIAPGRSLERLRYGGEFFFEVGSEANARGVACRFASVLAEAQPGVVVDGVDCGPAGAV